MENKMAAAVLAHELSFQAQLEQNIEREERARISLGLGKRERTALLEELMGWGLPHMERWEHGKRGSPPSGETGGPKARQGHATPAWNDMRPPPLTQKDDVEAYLATFECVAEACWWPRDHWASRLAPALSGSAQQAYYALGPCGRKDYKQLKEAILKGYNITAETRRQRFRQFCYPESERPLAVLGQLRELCYQWLKPERHSKEQILELLLLEQFVAILPLETQSWVRERGPESCRQAVALVEEFLRKRQDAKRWEQKEVAMETHEQKPTASEIGQRSPCQEGGSEHGVDSKSGPGIAMVPSEKEAQTLPRETSEAEELRAPSPGRQTGDLSPDQEKVCAIQSRTAKDPTTLSKEKDTTAVYHDSGLHKIQAAGGRQRSKSFGRQAELFRDKRPHPEEEPFQCPKCRRRFSERATFQQHLKSHFAEKRYQCTECEMRFRQSSDLLKHQRIHTGEKPYQCLECGKTFSLCSALYRHCRGHSGEKPFQCKECGKSFTRNSSLAQHHRLHKR
ncbi:zinc finger and SCAN domain-containing protein 23-like [Hemicordylus capensis]|uniref:zinc finger and SCAN domain-containing protein 23-like n=1 Tax=Hemicordylus capensis TaxID=884348 RepID=UPI002302B7DB|nr:zinc finger and SCAN domain-containing protein 23-like [Hemicordylus capensis]XP_053138620.1 zinc finger and SCAN domain-containing protein 23-like [Hemicordylus capensis]